MKLIIVAILVALQAFLWTTSTVNAQSNSQETVARFTVLAPDKPTYVLGSDSEVTIDFEVEYSGEEEKILLEAEFTILNSNGDAVFESESDLGEVRMILRSGYSVTKSISWPITDSIKTGTYTVTGILFEQGKSKREPFDERNEGDGISFDITENPDIRFLMKPLYFEDSEAGESIERAVTVRNSGGGILKWLVMEWPEWVELISPVSEITGEGEILLNITMPPKSSELVVHQRCGSEFCHYEALEVDSPEPYGKILVSSNDGDHSVDIYIASADPISGIADGEVTKFKVSDKEYRQGDEVLIEYVVENTGDVPMAYNPHLTIYHFSESFETTVAYDSDRDDSNQKKEDKKIILQPQESQEFTFVWPVSFREKTGDYFLETWLRYWDDWDVRFDTNFIDVRHGFEVNKGRRRPTLTISPSSIDLGTISQGDTLEAKLTIKNTAFGTLRWSVKEVPD